MPNIGALYSDSLPAQIVALSSIPALSWSFRRLDFSGEPRARLWFQAYHQPPFAASARGWYDGIE